MSAYSDRVIADGAVAYWRLDEASGTTAASQVGGYTGAITGGVTLAQPGALADGNKAMGFTGVDGMVQVPAGAYSAFGTGPASVEFWARTTSTVAMVPCGTSHLNSTGLIFYTNATAMRLRVYGAAVVIEPTATFAYADGAWHHYVGVVRRGSPNDTVEIWIDGVLRVSNTFATGTNLTATQPSFVGSSAANNEWIGGVDEVAVYPIDLTPQQIATHYALRQPLSPYAERVLTDGAVLYMRLDETSGTTARSLVGSYAGTLTGGVTINQPGALADGNPAMRFDGVNDYITTPNGGLTFPVNCTIEFWGKLRPETPSDYPHLVCMRDVVGPGHRFNISIRKPPQVLSVSPSDGTTTIYPESQRQGLLDDQWHHFVIVRTGPTVKFYIDGAADPTPGGTSGPAGVLSPGTPLIFGARPDIPTLDSMNGLLDEVAIYYTALTAQQIADHYVARTAGSESCTRERSRYRWSTRN